MVPIDDAALLEPDDDPDGLMGEMARLFRLDDRFLARALLRIARDARTTYPSALARIGVGKPGGSPARLVWDIIPEAARRLGEGALLSGEAIGSIRAISGEELRHEAWECFKRAPRVIGDGGGGSGAIDPWGLVRRDPVFGNPLLIALDRIAPPLEPSKDAGARYVAAMSRNRGLEGSGWSWRPHGARLVLDEAEMADIALSPSLKF
jgi:hypothetical protein